MSIGTTKAVSLSTPSNGFSARPTRCQRASARRAFAAVTVAAVSVLLNRSASVQADSLWDPNHIVSANGGWGIGNWDTTTANWYSTGSSSVAAFDGNNAFFNGPTGAYTVTLNDSTGTPVNINGGITFSNTSAGAGGNSGAIYSIAASVNASGYATVANYINFTGASTPTITINGTSYNSSSYTTTGNAAAGYALIGNSAPVFTNAPNSGDVGVLLNSSNGLNITGGGELILANPVAPTFSGTINISGGSTLTVGDRLLAPGPTNVPYTYLNTNTSLLLNGGQVQFATTASMTSTSAASGEQLGNITVVGSSALDIYRIASSASSSLNFVNSSLTLDAGNTAGTAANVNFYETGNTLGTGAFMNFSKGTTVTLPSGVTPNTPAAAAYFVTINATENSTGLVQGAASLKLENPILMQYTDNGATTFFLSGGNQNLTGGSVTLASSAASNSTGNWIIGNAAGTAGTSLETQTTAGTVGGLTTGSITINPYSSLFLDGDGVMTWGSSAQTITINGVGQTTYNSANGTVSGGNAGSLQFSSASNSSNGANYLESNVVLESSPISNYISVSSGTLSEIDGNITQNGSAGASSVTKVLTGILNLNGSGNTWTGGTFIQAGTINVSSTSSLGQYNPSAAGPLTLASQATSSQPFLNLSNAVQTVGSLSSSFLETSGTSSNAIKLNGTNLDIVQTTNGTWGPGAVSTLTSNISGSGMVTLDSTSTATLTFSGVNQYTGGTNISGGVLAVSNTAGSATGTNFVNVLPGGALGGSGIITGNVNVPGGTIVPGGFPSGGSHILGTLTFTGGLNLNGATLIYNLNTPTTSDAINLSTGALTLGATPTNVTLFNFGALAAGTYPLINFGSETGYSAGSFNVSNGGSLPGFNFGFTNTSSAIDLVVTAAPRITWTLSGSGNWDTGTQNWTTGIAPPGNTTYNAGTGAVAGTPVIFDDSSGGTSSTVTLASNLLPSVINFNNSAKSYTLVGAAITGVVTIADTGPGTAALNTGSGSGNSFTGIISVSGGGTLVADADNQLGALANLVALSTSGAAPSTIEFAFNGSTGRGISLAGSGGAIDVPNGDIVTVSGAIHGGGGLTVTDTGTLILSGVDTYGSGSTNFTNISSGTLQVGANTAIPAGTALTVASGATFAEGAFNSSIGSISGSGSIVFNTSGTTLTTGTSNGIDTFSGSITGPGAISEAGAGKLTLSNPLNSFSGGLLVSSGGTVIGGSSASSLGTGNFNLSGGGTLLLGAAINSSQVIYVGSGNGSINASGNSISVSDVVGTGTSTLTIYGGGSLNLTNTTNTASTNVSAGIIVGKASDAGGNNLSITYADSGGNTPVGVDISPNSGGLATWITVGSSNVSSNSLTLGSGTTGVQVGFNTMAGLSTTFLGHSLGNATLSTYSELDNSTTLNTPDLILDNGSTLIAHGFSAYNGGDMHIDDGATVTFSVPTVNDYLIEQTAVRNNGNVTTGANSNINVTGLGTVVLTSGGVSNNATGNTTFQGAWNIAMGLGASVGTGVTYTNTSTGALIAGPVTGVEGEPLNAFGYTGSNSVGAGSPINLFSGLLALGSDQADPATTSQLPITSFRSPINISGGAISSTGYDYFSKTTVANPYGGSALTYVTVGNSSSGTPVITANIAGNITLLANAVGTLLTYDPLNPSTGGRSLNIMTQNVGLNVQGFFTWGANSQLVISSNGTSGGAVNFGRTAGQVTVPPSSTPATLNISQGSVANIGFIPGQTGSSGLVSGIDPLSTPNFPYTGVNVIVNGSINWGGRTALAGDNLSQTPNSWAPNNGPAENLKSYAVGSLSINNGATGTLMAAAAADPNSYRTVLNVASLSIATTGKLDLVNNDMVVQNGNLPQISGWVAQGFNQGGWNGSSGIVSSAAAADTTHLHAIGVILNDDGTNTGTPLSGDFDGTNENNPDSDVLLKYTYYGDTDLSGIVDGSDYSRVDSSYLQEQTSHVAVTGWFNGDFNYDGVVDGSDYTLMDNAYNSEGASLAAEIAAPSAIATDQLAGASGSSAVPEPTTLGLLALGSIGLLGRRRRR